MNGWKKAAWGVCGSLVLLLIVTSAVALIDGRTHVSELHLDSALHESESAATELYVRQDVYEVQQEQTHLQLTRIEKLVERLLWRDDPND